MHGLGKGLFRGIMIFPIFLPPLGAWPAEQDLGRREELRLRAPSPGPVADQFPRHAALAKHYGGGATVSAVEHRVREVRKLAMAMKLTVARGLDPQQVTPDILKTVHRDMKDAGTP
jgi:hypothetical protein